MSPYLQLSIPLRSLLQLAFFCAMCLGIWLLPELLRRKRILPVVTVLLSLLLSAFLLLLYAANARAELLAQTPPALSLWLCRLPWLSTAAVAAVVLGCCSFLLWQEQNWRKNTLSRSSIKDALDEISSGLCFYRPGGRVILSNRSMNDLCFRLLGISLQNGELFFRSLQQGQVHPEAEQLSGGEAPSFRLSDGSVWTFSHEMLDGIHQLSAADTTQLQKVTDELKEKNLALAAMNLRLRQHGENVDALTRSKERLEIKMRIHSELGQALLSTRRFLLEEEGKRQPPLELWQKNISMLRKEAQLKEPGQPLELLRGMAAATGIETRFSGEFPRDEGVQRLLVQVAAEALTNAIRHAKAKTLFIRLDEDKEGYEAQFRNDGNAPEGRIVEGGGLGSLRRKIEAEGGCMKVSDRPCFTLQVRLPKKKEAVL